MRSLAIGPSAAEAGQPQSLAPPASKLAAAAKQFEALMLAQLLKEGLGSEGDWLGGGSDPGGATAAGLALEQFAQSLAQSGGLGLSDQIVSSLSSRAGDARPAPPSRAPARRGL